MKKSFDSEVGTNDFFPPPGFRWRFRPVRYSFIRASSKAVANVGMRFTNSDGERPVNALHNRSRLSTLLRDIIGLFLILFCFRDFLILSVYQDRLNHNRSNINVYVLTMFLHGKGVRSS